MPASQLIVISELMYHPQSELDSEEYIELFNNGSVTINLAGFTFSRGISYTIPAVAATNLAPGQRLVVAANVAAFTVF